MTANDIFTLADNISLQIAAATDSLEYAQQITTIALAKAEVLIETRQADTVATSSGSASSAS